MVGIATTVGALVGVVTTVCRLVGTVTTVGRLLGMVMIAWRRSIGETVRLVAGASGSDGGERFRTMGSRKLRASLFCDWSIAVEDDCKGSGAITPSMFRRLEATGRRCCVGNGDYVLRIMRRAGLFAW